MIVAAWTGRELFAMQLVSDSGSDFNEQLITHCVLWWQDFRNHLPVLFHVIVVSMDGSEGVVRQHMQQLLINLIHSLSVKPSKQTHPWVEQPANGGSSSSKTSALVGYLVCVQYHSCFVRAWFAPSVALLKQSRDTILTIICLCLWVELMVAFLISDANMDWIFLKISSSLWIDSNPWRATSCGRKRMPLLVSLALAALQPWAQWWKLWSSAWSLMVCPRLKLPLNPKGFLETSMNMQCDTCPIQAGWNSMSTNSNVTHWHKTNERVSCGSDVQTLMAVMLCTSCDLEFMNVYCVASDGNWQDQPFYDCGSVVEQLDMDQPNVTNEIGFRRSMWGWQCT